MKIKLTAYYSIFLGLAIIGLWVMILSTEEMEEGPTEMGFHLVSELLMALLAIGSGILLLPKHRMAVLVNTLAHGMVMYSVLNAAGYYGQQGKMAFVVMFLVLFVLSGVVVIRHLKDLGRKQW